MSVAYYIVLDRRIEGVDTTMDGKCLARAAEILDGIAESLDVRPISDFLSADPVQAAEFLTRAYSLYVRTRTWAFGFSLL